MLLFKPVSQNYAALASLRSTRLTFGSLPAGFKRNDHHLADDLDVLFWAKDRLGEPFDLCSL